MISKGFRKAWLSDPSTYPLFVVGGAAAVLVTFYLGRMTFKHPDGRFRSSSRKDPTPQNFDEGKKYFNHRLRENGHNSSEVFPLLNKISKYLTGYGGDKRF